MLHKIRHALFEREEFDLKDFIEVDETFYGGRRKTENRGRHHGPDKSLIVTAVKRRFARRGIRDTGVAAGNARMAVIPAASSDQLGSFIRSNVKAQTMILTDHWRGYQGLDEYDHQSVSGSGRDAPTGLPVVHTIFSNLKLWLNGTHHSVSQKHLPRYLREFVYCFNRRRYGDRSDFILRRLVGQSTITYRTLVGS